MAEPTRWVAPPRAPSLTGRPAFGPNAGDEHKPQQPSTAANAATHLAVQNDPQTASPVGADALLAATLEEILLWFRRAISKHTRALQVPPYPSPGVLAVPANPNRVGLIIRVPATALNPVYWSDNDAVSPNDSDGAAAGVPIFPGEAMIWGPEDCLCPTYLTTAVGGAIITVRIGEQIAAAAG